MSVGFETLLPMLPTRRSLLRSAAAGALLALAPLFGARRAQTALERLSASGWGQGQRLVVVLSSVESWPGYAPQSREVLLEKLLACSDQARGIAEGLEAMGCPLEAFGGDLQFEYSIERNLRDQGAMVALGSPDRGWFYWPLDDLDLAGVNPA